MSASRGAAVDTGNSITIAVRPESRLVEISNDRATLGLLADATGVTGTDADYGAVTGGFLSRHGATAGVALINLGPIAGMVVGMFRVGTRWQTRTFDDGAVRAWLRK